MLIASRGSNRKSKMRYATKLSGQAPSLWLVAGKKTERQMVTPKCNANDRHAENASKSDDEMSMKARASPCRCPCATCAIPLQCAEFQSDKGTRPSVPLYHSRLLETHGPFFSANTPPLMPHVPCHVPQFRLRNALLLIFLPPTALVQHFMYIQTPPLTRLRRFRPPLFGATRRRVAWSHTFAFRGTSTCFDV